MLLLGLTESTLPIYSQNTNIDCFKYYNTRGDPRCIDFPEAKPKEKRPSPWFRGVAILKSAREILEFRSMQMMTMSHSSLIYTNYCPAREFVCKHPPFKTQSSSILTNFNLNKGLRFLQKINISKQNDLFSLPYTHTKGGLIHYYSGIIQFRIIFTA